MLMFVILGLLDDFLGDGVKGFRGHFTPGHLSTGVVKAVGGILVAGAASFHIASGWWGFAVDVLLISLGANFFLICSTYVPGGRAKVLWFSA